MGTVSVALPSFAASRRLYGSTDVPVQLALTQPISEVLALVWPLDDADARPAANEKVQVIEPAIMADGVCLVVSYRGLDGLVAWASRLAAWLSDRGCSGEVRVASEVQPSSPVPSKRVSAGISGLIFAGEFLQSGGVGDLPQPLRGLVEWCLDGSTDAFLEHRWLSSQTSPAEGAGLLATALELGKKAALMAVAASGAFRRILIEERGHVILECAGGQGILDDADELERMLLSTSSQVVYGFVRRGVSPGLSWSDGVSLGFVDLPAAGGTYFRFLDEEERQYVPDAYPIQLLTPEQLARASDLSRWQVTPCGDKYLVCDPNRDDWLRLPLDDPTATRHARQDFGSMIMDAETIRAAVARRQAAGAGR